MADVPEWRVSGDWFDVCKCSIPCPCTFAQAPSEGDCEGILAWHIGEGHFGDMELDDLSMVALASFEGNIWTGAKADMAMFVDERADERQREALQTIWSGAAGGWPGDFSAMIGNVRGMELARIDFEIDSDLGSWRVEIPGKLLGEAEALTGPTSPEGGRVEVHNAPGAEVGPGQVATWGTATTDRADAFGFAWERSGKSSKHFPFDWSGPDGG
ncbi:MAG: DUF1326 domain-containing protein [Thermoleophilaceae bacterium]